MSDSLRKHCSSLTTCMELLAEDLTKLMVRAGMKEWNFNIQVYKSCYSDEVTISYSEGIYPDITKGALPMETILESLRRRGWKEENEPKPMPLLITTTSTKENENDAF